MERLIALGVDGIITDYPDRLRAVHGGEEHAAAAASSRTLSPTVLQLHGRPWPPFLAQTRMYWADVDD